MVLSVVIAGRDVDLKVVEDVANHRRDRAREVARVDHDMGVAVQSTDSEFTCVEGID
ncbi:hypothetical protein [Microtetraspora malaysiensis]|uniref:hypothetical protein n=1 Tax=Microtetraspora malaysiensis TaxID=161358 RepID=UPI003D925A55